MDFGLEHIHGSGMTIDPIRFSGLGLGFCGTRPRLDQFNVRVTAFDNVSRSASAVVEMPLEVDIEVRMGSETDVHIIRMGRGNEIDLCSLVLCGRGFRRAHNEVQLLDRLGA